MKKFLLFIWQFPQNLVGILVLLFVKITNKLKYQDIQIYKINKNFSVSLGQFVYVGKNGYTQTLLHELGHCRQSRQLGWLYLIVIGLPSVCGNLWDRIFHKKWKSYDRHTWYHNQKWEKIADVNGNLINVNEILTVKT